MNKERIIMKLCRIGRINKVLNVRVRICEVDDMKMISVIVEWKILDWLLLCILDRIIRVRLVIYIRVLIKCLDRYFEFNRSYVKSSIYGMV